MSVSMTLDAVRARQKTVTRRHVESWIHLKPGDRLTLIEKGMGLAKGAKQVVVAEVVVVSVRVEPLGRVTAEEVALEGLWDQAMVAMDARQFDSAPDWFIAFWCDGHGYRGLSPEQEGDVEARRIEWRYLDDTTSGEEEAGPRP